LISGALDHKSREGGGGKGSGQNIAIPKPTNKQIIDNIWTIMDPVK
jgi:hypothetical protein